MKNHSVNLKRAGENVLVGLGYFLLALVGLPHNQNPELIASLVWPASGFALAIILLRGFDRLPGLALGALLTSIYSRHSLPLVAVTAISVPLQAWIGAFQMRRLGGFRNDMHRVRDVGSFVALGALLSPVVGASLGVTTSCLTTGRWDLFSQAWSTWWIGDAMGILIVAPPLLTLFGSERAHHRKIGLRSRLLFVAGVSAISWLAFSNNGSFGHSAYPTAYLIYPVAIWAALKYGARGASLVTLIMALTAVLTTVGGSTTFISGQTPFLSVVYLWLFLAVLAVTSLTLAAVATERESARNEAFAAHRQLETFVEHTPAAVAMFDRRMRYLMVSHRWLRDYRLVEENIIGKSHYEIFPELPREWHEDHRRVLNGEIYRREQDAFLRQDGTIDWIRYELHPWRDSEGDIGGLIMITEVITERKKAEDALRASEARYRSLVSKLPGAIYRCNHDSRRAMESCSPFIEELTGYAAHELGIGEEGFARIIHPDDRAAAWRSLQDQLAHRNHYIVEYRILRKDGAERYILDKGNPGIGPSTPCLDGILFDMTDRKLREAEHLKAVKLESIGVLAGGIAHDFNNILTEIHGNIELAHLDHAPASTLPLLERAQGACARAAELARQLLTFAKGGEPVKNVADLVSLVREVTGFSLHGSNCSCRLFLPDEAWRIEIDVEQISLVIRNLVMNAVQAMPNGGVVAVRLENIAADQPRPPQLRPGPHLRLSIEDGGIGIDRAHLARIFDPYFTTKPNRSGLGLSTSLSIIRRHGGTIGAQSDKGNGARFQVYLPALTSADLPERETPARSADCQPSGRGRVLVLDDEEGIQRLLEAMLQKLGYEVVLTSKGEETIVRFREAIQEKNPFRFFMLDLTVPGAMGGKVAIEHLRTFDPDLLAMVVSGYSDDPIMANCREYGFAQALSKPFTFPGLCKTIGLLEAEGASRVG